MQIWRTALAVSAAALGVSAVLMGTGLLMHFVPPPIDNEHGTPPVVQICGPCEAPTTPFTVGGFTPVTGDELVVGEVVPGAEREG